MILEGRGDVTDRSITSRSNFRTALHVPKDGGADYGSNRGRKSLREPKII